MVESRYVYNPVALALERYGEEPTDYQPSTYQTKDDCLGDISVCKFSYSDGTAWEDSWGQEKGSFPLAIKVSFRFRDEDKEREFVVNIPISP